MPRPYPYLYPLSRADRPSTGERTTSRFSSAPGRSVSSRRIGGRTPERRRYGLAHLYAGRVIRRAGCRAFVVRPVSGAGRAEVAAERDPEGTGEPATRGGLIPGR